MLSPWDNAGLFLVQFLFDTYILVVLVRIILQWVGTDKYNPIFALAARLTDPPLRPVRRIIPVIHGIDFAAIILLVALEVIKLSVLVWMQIGVFPINFGLVILAFAELLDQLIDIFFYSILILAIMSWFHPLAGNPLLEVLYRISEPLMRPVRRVMPIIGGFDLSPIPVLIGLKLITMLVVQPLLQIGISLALARGIA